MSDILREIEYEERTLIKKTDSVQTVIEKLSMMKFGIDTNTSLGDLTITVPKGCHLGGTAIDIILTEYRIRYINNDQDLVECPFLSFDKR